MSSYKHDLNLFITEISQEVPYKVTTANNAMLFELVDMVCYADTIDHTWS